MKTPLVTGAAAGLKGMKVLVTGGAGYIGAHMVRVLLEEGAAAVVFDNLSTGHRDFVPRGVPFIKGDLRSAADVRRALARYRIEAVIHFAAAIVVPESVSDPLRYYDNNVSATVNLLQAMAQAGVRKIIFSSSACVYGEPKKVPITEEAPFKVDNPYGATKVMAEQILADAARAGIVDYIALRYFNVAGAHPSGEIGIRMEAPTHLVPNVMRVAAGRKRELTLFGTDYPTRDGSCVRDYIHVLDLCEAHALALAALGAGRVKNEAINLGTGRGYTVREVVTAAQEVTGVPLKVKAAGRRPGDCSSVVASFAKARRLLGWRPRRGLRDIIASAWAWERAAQTGPGRCQIVQRDG